MSNQDDVQNITDAQLEAVTGGGGVISKVAKVFSSGRTSLPKNPNPATSPEKRAAMQMLEDAIDRSPMPDHWKIIPKNPNEGARHA
jgi:hypothetical protein